MYVGGEYAQDSAGPSGSQKRATDPLEQELQVEAGCLARVLRSVFAATAAPSASPVHPPLKPLKTFALLLSWFSLLLRVPLFLARKETLHPNLSTAMGQGSHRPWSGAAALSVQPICYLLPSFRACIFWAPMRGLVRFQERALLQASNHLRLPIRAQEGSLSPAVPTTL